GSGAASPRSGARSAPCVGACSGRARRRRRAWPAGKPARWPGCCATRPTPARPAMARRTSVRGGRGCGRPAQAPSHRGNPTRRTPAPTAASPSPCRRWWTKRWLRRWPSNWRKTAAAPGSNEPEHATCCRACWYAPTAAMLCTAGRATRITSTIQSGVIVITAAAAAPTRRGGVGGSVRTGPGPRRPWAGRGGRGAGAWRTDRARVAGEYQRRLQNPSAAASPRPVGEALLHKVKRGIARLIDAYQDGLLDKAEFEPRLRGAKERLAQLEAEAQRQAAAV